MLHDIAHILYYVVGAPLAFLVIWFLAELPRSVTRKGWRIGGPR